MFYRWLAYRTFRMQTMRNWEHSLGEKVQKSVQNCVISVQKSYFLTKFFWGQAPRPPLERGIAPLLRSSNYPPTFQQAPTPLSADGCQSLCQRAINDSNAISVHTNTLSCGLCWTGWWCCRTPVVTTTTTRPHTMWRVGWVFWVVDVGLAIAITGLSVLR